MNIYYVFGTAVSMQTSRGSRGASALVMQIDVALSMQGALSMQVALSVKVALPIRVAFPVQDRESRAPYQNAALDGTNS